MCEREISLMFSRKQEVNSGQVRKKLKSCAGEPTNGGQAAEEMEAKFQLLNFFFCLINFIFLVRKQDLKTPI